MGDLPRLLVLTDRSQLHLGRSLVRTIEECVDAGLTHVILRELDETPLGRMALAAAFEGAGATVIAAHTPVFGASGVHVPATDLSGLSGQKVPSESLLSPSSNAGHDWSVGVSCHSVAEVVAAAAAGATYVTLSPYAESDSKPGYGPVLTREVFAEASAVGVPVYALGGITPDNAVEAIGAGVDGLAVMGSVMRAEDPAAVVADLLAILDEAPW